MQKENCNDVDVFKIKDHHGIELIGQSVAARRTCIVLPLYDLCFDMGYCPNSAMDQSLVLVTHGHADHCGALHFHAFDRKLHKLVEPTYVMPEECIDWFNHAYDGYKYMGHNPEPITNDRPFMLIGANKDQTSSPMTSYRLSSDQDVLLYLKKGGGKKYFVRGYRLHHGVPNVGYILWEIKKKLRPDLKHLSSREVGLLAKSGETVDIKTEIPTIGYTGDTMISGILNQPDMFKVETLIIECTYVVGDPDATQLEAKRRGHIHEDDLIENADLFENKELILCHFSLRYRRSQILEARDRIQKRFGDRLKVSVML